MSDETPPHDPAAMLAHLECPASAEIRATVEQFVAIADPGLVKSAGSPFNLLIKVLPFLDESREPERPSWLPANRVLGEWSGKWSTPPEKRYGKEDLPAFLLSPARALVRDEDFSHGWWMPQLGLGIVHEGKNRVRYLRETCRAERIPASVSTLSLPRPDRLQLLMADLTAGRFHALLLDGRWLSVLTRPDLSLPLLGAYGVAPRPWPDRWPSLDALLASRAWQPYGDRKWPAIDVEAWQQARRQRRDERETVVPGTPLSIAGVSTHWPGVARLAGYALAAGVIAGTCAVLQGPMTVIDIAGMAALALASGAALALLTPVLRGPRKFWTQKLATVEDESSAG